MVNIGKALGELNDFSRRRFLERAGEAVREEFLNPALDSERVVPNNFQLMREIEFFREKVSAEYKDVMEATLRETLKAYAPAHIEFTAEPDDPLVLKNIQDRIADITQVTGNPATTHQLVDAAGGVIDQIMENVLNKMPLAKAIGAGHSH